MLLCTAVCVLQCLSVSLAVCCRVMPYRSLVCTSVCCSVRVALYCVYVALHRSLVCTSVCCSLCVAVCCSLLQSDASSSSRLHICVDIGSTNTSQSVTVYCSLLHSVATS